ncbi:MAG TPA: hypothetical protein VGS15_01465 [Candidatus Acidoferrales bacterium]|nr:hypothetical protein [Candidatus Acidoferrales bacterium]
MKLRVKLAGILLGLFVLPVGLRAQQQSTPAEKPAVTHLRADLILAEYSGEKKTSSLPYTIYVAAGPRLHDEPWQSLRMGVRVPISMNDQGTQFNYYDVGTKIDCGAATEADGRYRIEVTIDRSSLYSPDQGSSGDQFHVSGGHPVLRSFNSGFDLALRDGETGEGISATDPFNGHVLKVSVTIHVVK